MPDHSPLTLLWLFALALISGVIDSMAGGGGLITLPGHMATGLDPVTSLAVSKFNGVFSALSATIHFWRKGKVHLRTHALPVCAALIASVAGAASLMLIRPDALKIVIPFLLIGISLWILFSPKLGTVHREARLSFKACALTLIPVIAFYNGFFGPGTGTFYALGLVALLGVKLDEATFRAKLYNLTSNFGALLFFVAGGHFEWVYAVVMATGTAIGGQIGARMILRHGTGLIKPALVAMSVAMSLKLLWQQGFLQKIAGF